MTIARLVLLLATAAAGLTPFSAVQASDTTPPTLERGEIDGGTVTLYYSEALDPDSVGGTFRVTVYTVYGTSVTVTAKGDVAISGNVVTVELGGSRASAGVVSRFVSWNPQGNLPVCSVDG